MRNPDGSPIESLKEFLMSTGDFESVLGHDNAAGVKIKKENVPKAIADCDELLKDVTMSKAIVVDFDFDYNKLNIALPKMMYEMRKVWAQGISEPYFYIRNIPLVHSGCAPMGKNGNMWKYSDEEKALILCALQIMAGCLVGSIMTSMVIRKRNTSMRYAGCL